MIDKNDSQGQQGTSTKQPLRDSPIVAREEIKLTSNAAKQSEQQESGSSKPFLRFEKIQLWMNGVGILVGAVVCVIYGFQLHVMKSQLAEMKGGSTDTHELAVQAKNQADAAKAQSDATKAQAESTKAVATSGLDQAKATNKLAVESARSADAAVANSKAAQMTAVTAQKNLLLAERVLFVQERPWVGTSIFNATVDSDGKISGTIAFNNFGRSPAFDVEMRTACTITKPPDLSIESTYIFAGIGSKSILMPGNSKSSDGLTCELHLSSTQSGLVEQGFAAIYLFGLITYRDGINTSNPLHTTRFCGRWNSKTKIFDECTVYTSAD